jgi:kinesin family protein 11
MENATREDVPTGSTPRKRVWEYDDDWERTGTREAVLRDWAMRKQLDQQLKRDEEVRKRFSVSVSAAPVAHNIADDPSDPEEVDDAETGDTASAHEEPASEPAEELVEPAPAPAPTPVFSIVAPSKDSKLVPASTVRSSRQSKMLPPSRPPSKIGTASRTISGKGVPLTEKGNTASRNKRVK